MKNCCLAGRGVVEGKGRIFLQTEVVVCSCGREEERKKGIGRGKKNPVDSVSLKLEDPGGSGQEEGLSTVCLSVYFAASVSYKLSSTTHSGSPQPTTHS